MTFVDMDHQVGQDGRPVPVGPEILQWFDAALTTGPMRIGLGLQQSPKLLIWVSNDSELEDVRHTTCSSCTERSKMANDNAAILSGDGSVAGPLCNHCA